MNRERILKSFIRKDLINYLKALFYTQKIHRVDEFDGLTTSM